jgi:transposase-like protein
MDEELSNEEEQVHRGADHRRGEAAGGPGRAAKEVARELGVTDQTLYNWKSKYGGMEVRDAQRLSELEDENRAAEDDGGRPQPGQGSAESGDPKKRMELVGARRDIALVVAAGPQDVPVDTADRLASD